MILHWKLLHMYNLHKFSQLMDLIILCFSEHSYTRKPSSVSPDVVSGEHICSKSIYMELKLQKAEETIAKLKKKVVERTSQVNRLQAALKRATLSKMHLKDVLQEIKTKNMISDEGYDILQVNIFTL